MQELEKILEEIEQKKEKCLNVVKMEIDPMEITIHREQYKGLCMAEESIRKHMNDDWISVDERLPEDDRMVLVTCQTKKGIRSVNRAYCDGAFWHGSGSMSGVIAWRPLPDPYRPERSDNNDGE